MTEAAIEAVDVESMELIVGDQVDVQVVFQGPGMGSLIDSIERIVGTFVPDATTDDGRKDIISLAYKVSQSKTFLEKKGVAVTADWKAKTKVVNDNIKIAKTRLDALRDKTRKPVTDWEVAEAETLRIETDRRRDALKEYQVVLPDLTISTMTWEEFENALFIAKEDWEEAERVREEQDVARKKEELRLEEVRIEQEAIAEEQKKIAEAQEVAQATIKREQKAAQDKLDADRKALDAEKARIAKEQADKQAEIDKRFQAERDAKVKAAREATEKKEAERWALKAKEREEEMQPDREKLAVFFANVQIVVTDVQCAPLSTTEGARELSRSFDSIRATIDECKKRTEEL